MLSKRRASPFPDSGRGYTMVSGTRAEALRTRVPK